MKNLYLIALASALLTLCAPVFAESPDIIIELPAAGSVSTEEGFKAWGRAYELRHILVVPTAMSAQASGQCGLVRPMAKHGSTG